VIALGDQHVQHHLLVRERLRCIHVELLEVLATGDCNLRSRLTVPHEVRGDEIVERRHVVPVAGFRERADDLLVGFTHLYLRCVFWHCRSAQIWAPLRATRLPATGTTPGHQ